MEMEEQELHNGECWQTPPESDESRLTSRGINCVVLYNFGYGAKRKYFPSVLFFPQTLSPDLIMKKHQTNPK